ncbi:MAG TPA: hypothetical protein VER03_21040, partial [Bryobacteraceae bacterium]|nr:hypothetical protein [Bryobacteraceae bacterium]
MSSQTLAFGFQFDELYSREGVTRLDSVFLERLGEADPPLRDRLLQARSNPKGIERKAYSELIIAVAPYLEDFLAELFGITAELRALQQRHYALAPLFSVKRRFVFKKAASGMTPEKAAALDGPALAASLQTFLQEPLTESSYVDHVSRWLDDEAAHAEELKVAAQYAAWAALSPAGRERHHGDVLFKLPHKLDPLHLVPVETVKIDGGASAFRLHPSHWRQREGFALTDPGTDLAGAIDQASYCIKCHNQLKDSCSTGLREKTGEFKKSVFGVTLNGCPLDEKI